MESRFHNSADVQSPMLDFSIGNEDIYAHKFMLIDIPTGILESIYEAVSILPITHYEVICSALKQIRFYKAFNMLFPEGENKRTELLSVLKSNFFVFHPHLDSQEVNATVLVTDGPMRKPQMPHMDYSWESILLPTRHDSRRNRSKLLRGCAQLPLTGHMPVSKDGAFIYLWTGPGAAVPFHIEYGKMLIIRGDVVHCGGLPTYVDTSSCITVSIFISW